MPPHIITPREAVSTDLALRIAFRDAMLFGVPLVLDPVMAVHVPFIGFADLAAGAGATLDALFVVFHMLAIHAVS